MQATCDDHEQRRDVNRIAAHPRDRLVVIRCRDAEHDNSKRLGIAKCKRLSKRAPASLTHRGFTASCQYILELHQFFLGQPAEAFKLEIHRDRSRTARLMENIAPAISAAQLASEKTSQPTRRCSIGCTKSSR